MLPKIHSVLEAALGLDLKADQLNVGQMSLRAFVIFFVATAMIRIGNQEES